MALQIADQAWDFVNPEKLSPPGTYPDFAVYVAEKIEISQHAAEVKKSWWFYHQSDSRELSGHAGAKRASGTRREG